jgi:hypothetical protein
MAKKKLVPGRGAKASMTLVLTKAILQTLLHTNDVFRFIHSVL